MRDCHSGQVEHQEPLGQESACAVPSLVPSEQWRHVQGTKQAEENWGLWASLAGGGLEIWLPAPVSSLTCYVNLSSNVALHVLQMVDGTVEYMRYLCDLVKTQLYGF